MNSLDWAKLLTKVLNGSVMIYHKKESPPPPPKAKNRLGSNSKWPPLYGTHEHSIGTM